jgi:hypothetical protein
MKFLNYKDNVHVVNAARVKRERTPQVMFFPDLSMEVHKAAAML